MADLTPSKNTKLWRDVLAEPQTGSNPLGPLRVGGEHVGGEAEFGIVGELHGLVVGVETEQRRQRAEGLLACDFHLRIDVGDHGGLSAFDDGDDRVCRPEIDPNDLA